MPRLDCVVWNWNRTNRHFRESDIDASFGDDCQAHGVQTRQRRSENWRGESVAQFDPGRAEFQNGIASSEKEVTTLGEKARAAAFRRLREHWAHRAIAIMLLMMTVLIFGEKDREWLVSLIESFSGGRGQAAFHDLVTPSSGEQVLPPFACWHYYARTTLKRIRPVAANFLLTLCCTSACQVRLSEKDVAAGLTC
jgi:hypothetical protein